MIGSIRTLPKDVYFYFGQKRKQANLKKHKYSSIFSENLLLQDLTENGFTRQHSLLSSNELLNIRQRYGLRKENFSKSNSNISLPFIGINFLQKIDYETGIGKLIREYFLICYRSEPVLQSMPTVVVTNPSIQREEFNEKMHRIPAFFHTDYPTELTVHLPLTDITSQTPRTMYLNGSSMASSVRPMKKYDATDVACKFESSELFAKAGDALVIDVTGVHKAIVSPQPRIMLQLKFTSGQNILESADPDKLNAQIELARSNFNNYRSYIKTIKEDWMQIPKADVLTPELKHQLIRLKNTIEPFFR